MVCTHNIQHLIGKSDGIYCKNCGRRFDNFDEIEDDRKSKNLGANPDFNDVIDNSIEKSKTEAVPPEVTARKGAKTSKKKAVSIKTEGAK
ncbi:MAG: hypothetical protein IIZ78_17695 [Clostridiales bacterium]|nr:hypothetical protein [Clostridiales bacterium]